MEMTSYRKLGIEVEKEESDEYKVLSDQSMGRIEYEYGEIEDDPEAAELFAKEESVEVIDGVQIESSLLKETNDPSLLETEEVMKLSLKDDEIDPN